MIYDGRDEVINEYIWNEKQEQLKEFGFVELIDFSEYEYARQDRCQIRFYTLKYLQETPMDEILMRL